MTLFFLIRHALHSFGSERIAGRTPDVHLSDAGRVQAEALARHLAPVAPGAIYCSPLERTCETAEAVAAHLNLPVQTANELQELDFGDWTGQSLQDLRPRDDWRRFNAFRSGSGACKGEFMLEVQARIVHFMLRLAEHHPGGRVALVSHGDVIKSAAAYFMGVPLDLFQRIEISPASVSIIGIADYGPWVLCLNHTGSLSDLPELS